MDSGTEAFFSSQRESLYHQQGVCVDEAITFLQTVKVSQSQHGLRHGDHTRYRQYCTHRLARLYKSLKFTHGRGRYQKRVLEASMIVDER